MTDLPPTMLPQIPTFSKPPIFIMGLALVLTGPLWFGLYAAGVALWQFL
jgi:hypothetical protein